MDGRDLNDNAILAATRVDRDAKGAQRFQLTLPSGRELTSEWLTPENASKAVVTWCEAVRGAHEDDLATMKRDARLARAHTAEAETDQDPTTTVTAPSGEETGISQEDPDQMIVQTIERLEERAELLRNQKSKVIQDLDSLQETLAKWEAIAEGLGLHTHTEPDVDDTEEETE